MMTVSDPNDIDQNVDVEIYNCLNPSSPKSFFLFAGAGSGKTRTLVNVLDQFKKAHGDFFRSRRKKVAIITYTNAAADEITHRLAYDPIFKVSTIHSFSWELISHLTWDIRSWLKNNLSAEIDELQITQGKSKNLTNKTSLERAKKIKSKTERLQSLDGIVKFVYNPSGDNITKDSLNHSEVIAATSNFILTKSLMQEIVTDRFPLILVDESQDTKKDLVDALFTLQSSKKDKFSLGLLGDTMQRIYSDGKENLGRSLPDDWAQPIKKMNHRSQKRIIDLVNDIRKAVDNQVQQARIEKDRGVVRFFISSRVKEKAKVEKAVGSKMAEITNDERWLQNTHKTLILEHHMAAKRMNFFEFFEPLYEEKHLSTGMLNGSLSSIGLFTRTILPIVRAHRIGNEFQKTQICKQYSPLLTKQSIKLSEAPSDLLAKANDALTSLCSLWEKGNDPILMDILENVSSTGLFAIPSAFIHLISFPSEQALVPLETEDHALNSEELDSISSAWKRALSVPFSQIENYDQYLSEDSRFGTHQGVKGLEFDRVMVIIDDEEAKGFMFSYDKLFGAKALSDTDMNNLKDGKDTSLDRTRRLFYVACSRAKESLAIVAYTSDVHSVKQTMINNEWFKEQEIEILA